MFLHKRYVHELEINDKIGKIRLIPVYKLKIQIDWSLLSKTNDLFDYLQNDVTHKVPADVWISDMKKTDCQDFDQFMDCLFENLTVISFDIKSLTNYWGKIFRNQPLDSVILRDFVPPELIVDIIENNLNVKQWIIEKSIPKSNFHHCVMLEKLMGKKYDNSVILRSKYDISDFPQISKNMELHLK